MDEVMRRLEALEYEVKRLRSKVRKENLNSGLTLDSAIQVQSLPGDSTKDVFFGYEGPLYKDIASDLTGLSTATDPFTRIQSTVSNTDRDALLHLIAAEPDGALIQEYAWVKLLRDNGGDNLVSLTAANSSDVGTLTVYPTNVALDIPFALLATGSDPSSPADGWIFYRTDTDTLRLRANSAWVDLATTTHTHTSSPTYYKDNNGTSGRGPAATTSETSLGSFIVTGGDMGTTGVLRVRLMGTYTGSGASTTVTLRIKFGGSTLYADASAAFTAAGQPWFAEIHLANVGSASVQRGGGFILMGGGAATTGAGDLATDEILATTPIAFSASANTASNQTFEVTAQLSDGTSPNSFICLSMVAELL